MTWHIVCTIPPTRKEHRTIILFAGGLWYIFQDVIHQRFDVLMWTIPTFSCWHIVRTTCFHAQTNHLILKSWNPCKIFLIQYVLMREQFESPFDTIVFPSRLERKGSCVFTSMPWDLKNLEKSWIHAWIVLIRTKTQRLHRMEIFGKSRFRVFKTRGNMPWVRNCVYTINYNHPSSMSYSM